MSTAATSHEPIHHWFELTYSNYLVLPRSILQSMPQDWQARFVRCLEELRDVAPDDAPDSYWVRATSGNRFVRDPYSNYERGRRVVELRSKGVVTP
jgi:hypothetical protein